ncbi:MAG TPA: energy transducer TonB [Vicinamibacterales bacterium]|jgi:TonB family protein|nr:energy transducer TonB [Vicinamibacterales bacterium]
MKRLIVLLSVAGMCFVARPAFAQKPAGGVHVRGYSIVLLLGDTQGTSMPDTLSSPARKALTDVKDFLPYRSYKVLDTQWLAGSDTIARSSGLLRGVDEAQMPFNLASSALNQSFKLWSADGRTNLLDATFTERPGETVVVGTSRVQGNRALIVLLSIVTDLGDTVYEPGTPGIVSPAPTGVRPKPTYTQEALKAQIAGVIRLSGIVRANGTLTDVTVIKGLDPDFGLNDQAIKSASAWQFKPGMRDGKPVDVRVTLDVEFTMR